MFNDARDLDEGEVSITYIKHISTQHSSPDDSFIAKSSLETFTAVVSNCGSGMILGGL